MSRGRDKGAFQEVKDGTKGEARKGDGRQKVEPAGNHQIFPHEVHY